MGWVAYSDHLSIILSTVDEIVVERKFSISRPCRLIDPNVTKLSVKPLREGTSIGGGMELKAVMDKLKTCNNKLVECKKDIFWFCMEKSTASQSEAQTSIESGSNV